uniref:DUF7356 domain-containing protein n=1 Tax=Nelumbo nucifera TaxID=4432 RepID=A0A822Z6M4_NELNU|nr:TPA_asm: hypothetical protein HUJ06_012938 [Nelumbo nucifera]
MESKGVLAVILLILIFTEGSHAFFLGKLRIRASKIAPKEKPAGKEIPPSPSPTSMPSLDSSHLSPDNSTKARPKGSDGQGAQIPQTKTPSNQSGNKSNSPVGSPEGNCADTPNRCTDKKKMIACLKHSENGNENPFPLRVLPTYIPPPVIVYFTFLNRV